MTDTADESAERVLQTTLEALPDLQALTLVSGLDDPEAVEVPAVTTPREEPRHDSP